MENIGQIFRAARERKNVDLSKAASLTHIKIQHLQMMENNDFSKMPAPTYAKGFIRIYANYLGIDPAPLIQIYVDTYVNPPARAEPKAAPKKTAPVAPPAPPVVRRHLAAKALAQAAGEKLRAAGRFIAPYVPMVIVTSLLVLLLTMAGRCVARLGQSSPEPSASAPELNPQAILEEPPAQYLDIPVTKENEP